MKKVDRRSALTVGLAAASAALVKPARAQPAAGIGFKDATPSPGVTVRSYGTPTKSLIPGFKTVSMRDFIVQPGATGNPAGTPMANAMVCHMLEGELQIDQNGQRWTAGKNYVWTCNKGTKETVRNSGTVAAIMRITDLRA